MNFFHLAKLMLPLLLMLWFIPACEKKEVKDYGLAVFQVDSKSGSRDYFITWKGERMKGPDNEHVPHSAFGVGLDAKQEFDGNMKIVNGSKDSIKLAIYLVGGHKQVEMNSASYGDMEEGSSLGTLINLYNEGKKEELLERWKQRREKSKYLAIELEPGEEYPVPWRIK